MIPQTIKEHTFTKTEGGESYTCRCYGEDLEASIERNLSKGDGYEYQGTKEKEYLYSELAWMVAAALAPGKWTPTPQSDEHANCNWNIAREDGLTIYLSGPRYGGMDKFHFGVSLPRDNGSYVEPYDESNHRLSVPSIGCSVKKSPEQMAKEIERRLLPLAEQAHQSVLRQIERNQGHRASQDAIIARLAEAAGKPIPKENYSKERPVYVGSLTLQAGHDGSSVMVAGYVTAETAIKLAELAKQDLDSFPEWPGKGGE